MNDEGTTTHDVGDLLAPGGKVYYSSDPHFFHPRIIELCGRPFRDVFHMHEVLVANHNAVVSPEDTCVFLGDMVMGRGIEDNLSIVDRLNGRKLLIPGNHDRVSWTYWRKGSPKTVEHKRTHWYHEYSKHFDAILPDLEPVTRHIAEVNETVILSHYPYQGDSHDADRFETMRPADDGRSIVVHGHVHEKWQRNGRQLNVGVGVNHFTPVSEETLAHWIREYHAL